MKYYLIGIKGSGMSALALILSDLGNQIWGYDDELSFQFTETKLHKRHIPIYHDKTLSLTKDLVIIRSAAIKDNHPEIIRCHQKKLQIFEYNEMIGKITKEIPTITVSGCHGKTTTSSMLSHVLNNTIGCNYLIGDGSGYSDKKNKLFVLEACEYERHFLAYTPEYSIITNIDLDHVDYYKNISDIKNAYEEYANKTSKLIIAWGDDPYIHDLTIKKPIVYYGLNSNNDMYASNIKYDENGTTFDVYLNNNLYNHFYCSLPGEHMVLNSLAVITACIYNHVDSKDIVKYIANFKGAKRRFNENVIASNVIIDDYAHHPKEIETLISAVRQKYPNKKIVAIFEPHTYSRTKTFYKEIAQTLNTCDKTFLLNIYASREKQADFPNITSKLILDLLINGEMAYNITKDKILKCTNTVFLFMSPKEMQDIKNEVINYLTKNN